MVGEGRNRRSITRHVNRERIGLNIDERAIPLNELYEEELAEAESNLAAAKAVLEQLQTKLEKVNEAELDNIGIDAAKAMLQGMIGTAALEVYAAEFIVDDAKAKLAIVRRELPLMMEFVAPFPKFLNESLGKAGSLLWI